MATILFIGTNPSNASNVNTAFDESTRSGQILSSWAEGLTPGTLQYFLNVTSQKTQNNRPLSAREIKEALGSLASSIQTIRPDKIVALGKTAAKALTLLGVSFYEMPHPSGRNRLLNDPKFVDGKVKGLLEFCSSSPNTNLASTSD